MLFTHQNIRSVVTNVSHGRRCGRIPPLMANSFLDLCSGAPPAGHVNPTSIVATQRTAKSENGGLAPQPWAHHRHKPSRCKSLSPHKSFNDDTSGSKLFRDRIPILVHLSANLGEKSDPTYAIVSSLALAKQQEESLCRRGCWMRHVLIPWVLCCRYIRRQAISQDTLPQLLHVEEHIHRPCLGPQAR